VEVSRLFRSFGGHGTGNLAADQDPTFIDGLAGSALDPGPDGYRARHAQPDGELVEAADEWAVDESGSDDFRFAVRPYTWTRGRTQPVQDLAFETLVSTSDEGRNVTAICSAEHAAIAELCLDIRSVAEVAAMLALPLGVARVLLADMIDTGLMRAYHNPMGLGSAAELMLMERVLDGLYRI
jgi:hypothetical protein